MKYRSLRGTIDIFSPETYLWNRLEQDFADIAKCYGFSEIRTPSFEDSKLYLHAKGPYSKRVLDKICTFKDKNGNSIALRPEATTGVIRAYLQKDMQNLPAPQKLFYNLSFFRWQEVDSKLDSDQKFSKGPELNSELDLELNSELDSELDLELNSELDSGDLNQELGELDIQHGFYSEQHQLGCECIGSSSYLADAELISLVNMFFERENLPVGVPGSLQLKINSLGCAHCKPSYDKELEDYLSMRNKELCEQCSNLPEGQGISVFACKKAPCLRLSREAPAPSDYLCKSCADHFAGLRDALKTLKIDYTYAPYMINSFDYYTKTLFSFVSSMNAETGEEDIICEGGRYDSLIENVGGASTPAVGFAICLEKLMQELETRGIDEESYEEISPPNLYIAARPDCLIEVLLMAEDLRREGLSVISDIIGGTMKDQMKYAARINASYVLLIGKAELAKKKAKIKRMSDGKEMIVHFNVLSEYLLSSLLSESLKGI